MEFMAEFERIKSVFREHPVIVQTMELKAAAETEFLNGSVLMKDGENVTLATDAMTAKTCVGILSGSVTLRPDETTMAAVALHGNVVLDQLHIAEGATPTTIAAVLKTVGIYAY